MSSLLSLLVPLMKVPGMLSNFDMQDYRACLEQAPEYTGQEQYERLYLNNRQKIPTHPDVCPIHILFFAFLPLKKGNKNANY